MSVTAVPLRPIKKGSVAKLWISLIVLAALAAAFAWWGTAAFQTQTTPSGVGIRTLRAGAGPRFMEMQRMQQLQQLQQMQQLQGGSPDGPPPDGAR